MLEKIRESSQGVVAKGILILVILSFAFAGVSSYLGAPTVIPAATVNGQEITQTELEQAYQNERARLEQELGDLFPMLAANDDYLLNIKKSVLDRLIAQTLIEQASQELGLYASDEQIKQTIREMEVFQSPTGEFDNQRYLAVTAQMGYQPAQFGEMLRSDISSQQFVTALFATEFVLDAEAEQIAKLQQQTRDIQYKVVESAPFVDGIEITAEAVQSYYDTNQAQFMSEEMISLEYISLNADDIAATIEVNDADAQAYYDDNKNAYQTAEKRLAAHILFDAADEAKANDVFAQLQAGADFAELAKANSMDTFSAENGGQLDWFEPGVMDPAFDEALFAIASKGGISAVVRSDFGFHIIKLIDLQAQQVAEFASVKDKIIADLQQDKALDEFYELKQSLSNTSFEVPDSLIESAEAINGQVQTSALFSRNHPPAEFNNAELLAAVFSDQVLLDGMNSDLIETSANEAIVVRIKEHKHAGVLPFAEVEADIKAQLTQEKATELARTEAQALMQQAKAGESVDGLTTATAMTRFAADVEKGIVDQAFKMPAPAADSVSVATAAVNNGFAFIVLDKVNTEQTVEAELMNAMKQQLTGMYSDMDYLAFIADLKAKATIEYHELSVDSGFMN